MSLNGTNGFSVQGLNGADNLCFAVSTAGDINKDGKSDLIIGAPGAGNGTAYVIFGQTTFPPQFDLTTLNGTNGFSISALNKNDFLTLSVGTVSDVNADEIDDFIIGAPFAENGLGIGYVIFGQTTFPTQFNLALLNGTNGFAIAGLVEDDYLGGSVSTAGDINHDGKKDIVIGAYKFNSGQGVSYVIFGQPTFPAQFNLTTLNGTNGFSIQGLNTGDALGYSVSTAGDINADGKNDLVLGAAFNNIYQGACYIIFGQTTFPAQFNLTTLNGSNGFGISGLNINDELGYSLSTAGDINADGKADLILGAPYHGNGSSYVIFGRSSFPAQFNLTTLNGTNGFTVLGLLGFGSHGASLGWSVSTAGDINNDGIADLIIGSPESSYGNSANDYEGAIYVIFGQRTSTIPSSSAILSAQALANGNFIAVYQSGVNAYIQILNATGIAISNKILLPAVPAVSIFPNNYFMVTYQNASIYDSQVFNANGTAISALIPLPTSPVTTVLSNGNIVLTYQTGLNTNVAVFNSNGTAIDQAISISGIFANITALPNSNFVVTTQNGANYDLQVFNGNGMELNNATSFMNALSNVLVSPNSNFLVTYQNASSYITQNFDSSGTLLNSTIQTFIPTHTALLANGNAVFTFQNGNSTNVQVFNENGNAINNAIALPVSPTVTVLPNSNFLLTYQNGTRGSLQVFNTNGIAISKLFSFTNTFYDLTILQDGHIVLAYQSGTASYIQVFDENGNVINNAVQLAGDFLSITAFFDSRFVVIYQNQLNDYTQLFDPSGNPLGNAVQLLGSSSVVENQPPIVLNAPINQFVAVSQPFNFSIETNQIFNDTDGDTLAFFATANNESVLPSWIQLEENNASSLIFTGTAPVTGNTQLNLFAKDPLNQIAKTDFDILAIPSPTNTVSNDRTQIASSIAGGLAGLALLVGSSFGFWRYMTNKNSRQGEQFADDIRETLKLNGLDNFNHEIGQKYITFVHHLVQKLQDAG